MESLMIFGYLQVRKGWEEPETSQQGVLVDSTV